VKRHDGRISVDSEVNHRTLFTIVLPIHVVEKGKGEDGNLKLAEKRIES
jgi:nitrogen-specific signal transduction histidine kinase